MRTGLGIALVVTWALASAALLGPRASISQVTVLWLGGLLVVMALGLAWSWLQEDADFEDAPFTTNRQWAIGFVLLAIGVPFLMLFDAVRESWIGSRVGYWRDRLKERWHRPTALHGDDLCDRAKRLEGTAPRMRF